jgi:hypothetical protein
LCISKGYPDRKDKGLPYLLEKVLSSLVDLQSSKRRWPSMTSIRHERAIEEEADPVRSKWVEENSGQEIAGVLGEKYEVALLELKGARAVGL